MSKFSAVWKRAPNLIERLCKESNNLPFCHSGHLLVYIHNAVKEINATHIAIVRLSLYVHISGFLFIPTSKISFSISYSKSGNSLITNFYYKYLTTTRDRETKETTLNRNRNVGPVSRFRSYC